MTDDGDVAEVVEDPAEAPGLAEDGVVDEPDLRDLHRVHQRGVEQPGPVRGEPSREVQADEPHDVTRARDDGAAHRRRTRGAVPTPG